MLDISWEHPLNILPAVTAYMRDVIAVLKQMLQPLQSLVIIKHGAERSKM